MKMTHPASDFAAFAAACVAVLAVAETAFADDTNSFRHTFQEYVARATNRAARSGFLDEDLIEAELSLNDAKARFIPHLTISPEGRYYFKNDKPTYDLRADIGQHLLQIPQNLINKRVAKHQLKSAEFKRGRKVNQFATTAARSYIELQRLRQNLALNTNRCDLAARSAERWRKVASDDVAVRKKKEEALETERLAAQMQEQLAAVSIEMEGQVRAIGAYPAAADVVLAALPEYVLPPLEWKTCRDWALANRGDLAAMRIESEMVKQAVKLARLDRLPKPRLSVGYTSSDWNSGSDSAQSGDNDGFFAALTLEIPIWDGGEISGRVRALEAKRRAIDSGLLMLEARITQEALKAYAELRQAFVEYEMERKNEKPSEEARTAEARWRSGEINELEYRSQLFAFAEQQASVARKNIACYEAEVALWEALQADAGQIRAGLRMPAPAGGSED